MEWRTNVQDVTSELVRCGSSVLCLILKTLGLQWALSEDTVALKVGKRHALKAGQGVERFRWLKVDKTRRA